MPLCGGMCAHVAQWTAEELHVEKSLVSLSSAESLRTVLFFFLHVDIRLSPPDVHCVIRVTAHSAFFVSYFPQSCRNIKCTAAIVSRNKNVNNKRSGEVFEDAVIFLHTKCVCVWVGAPMCMSVC